MKRDAHPLIGAINGRPDEPTAARQIATWTVLPVAVAGILGGAVLTPAAAGFGRLVLYGVGGGVLAATVTLAGVMLLYRLVGFRAVVGVGEAVFGLLAGFFVGVTLTQMFMLDWWPLLLAPAFAVLNVVFRPFTRPAATPEPLSKQPKTWEEPAAQSPEPADSWAVCRTDDAGNSFLVQRHLTREAAERLAGEFAARGHKQHYTVERDHAG